MLLKEVVGVALGVIFGLLSALHVFWAFGGTWGSGAAVAEVNGRPRFVPSKGATLVVAAALAVAAVVVLTRAHLVLGSAPPWAAAPVPTHRARSAVVGLCVAETSSGDIGSSPTGSARVTPTSTTASPSSLPPSSCWLGPPPSRRRCRRPSGDVGWMLIRSAGMPMRRSGTRSGTHVAVSNPTRRHPLEGRRTDLPPGGRPSHPTERMMTSRRT